MDMDIDACVDMCPGMHIHMCISIDTEMTYRHVLHGVQVCVAWRTDSVAWRTGMCCMVYRHVLQARVKALSAGCEDDDAAVCLYP